MKLLKNFEKKFFELKMSKITVLRYFFKEKTGKLFNVIWFFDYR